MIVHNIAGFFRRNAAIIPISIIALSIFGILLLLAITNSRLTEQLKEQNTLIAATKSIAEQIKNDSKDRDKAISDLNKHMDCIVQFFKQPDNADKSIADIQKCRIVENADANNNFIQQNTPSSVIHNTSQPTSNNQSANTAPSTKNNQPSSTTPPPKNPGDSNSTISALRDILSLPLVFIRQLPIIGGS